jgi:hypothetical protein
MTQGDNANAHLPARRRLLPLNGMCISHELRLVVSERSNQALSWCKSQVHMFEGDLIVLDKLGAHHEAHRI